MNQKNSLGLDKCFGELDDPIKLFEKLMPVFSALTKVNKGS